MGVINDLIIFNLFDKRIVLVYHMSHLNLSTTNICKEEPFYQLPRYKAILVGNMHSLTSNQQVDFFKTFKGRTYLEEVKIIANYT